MRSTSLPALNWLGLAVVAICFTGCSTMGPSSKSFRSSFLPPNPAAPAASPESFDPPPALAPILYSNSLPNLSIPQLPPKPTQADARIRRAEDSFKEGKKLFLAGDRAGARKLFDQALDSVLNASDEPTNQTAFDKRFEDLVQAIYRMDVDGDLEEAANQPPKFDKAPIDDISNLTFPFDPRIKNKVSAELDATTSQLPLEVSDAVLGFINYFSSERGKKTLIGGWKRMGRYKPMISRILDEEGVPQELIYLAQAESGFLPRAMSNMAAVGMWQFVKFRGNEYGLKQTPYADERMDPEMATRAAARHLRDLYNQFGDWYLAIAAYNCGPGTVDRAIARTGYADIWELRSRGVLPLETSNYVPIILAMTIMSKNPKDYGLDDVDMDTPIQYDTFVAGSLIHLPLIADAAQVAIGDLKEMNPSLVGSAAPAGYPIRIPKGKLTQVATAMRNVPEDKRGVWRLHRAEEGDSLTSIAKRYNTQFSALETANIHLVSNVEQGDFVVLPAAPVVVAAVRSGYYYRGRWIATRPSVVRTASAPSTKRAVAPARVPAKRTTVASKTPARNTKAPVRKASTAINNKKTVAKRA